MADEFCCLKNISDLPEAVKKQVKKNIYKKAMIVDLLEDSERALTIPELIAGLYRKFGAYTTRQAMAVILWNLISDPRSKVHRVSKGMYTTRRTPKETS